VESGQQKHAEQQKGRWMTRQGVGMKNFMCVCECFILFFGFRFWGSLYIMYTFICSFMCVCVGVWMCVCTCVKH